MPASPATSVPTISPGEMQLLLSRAGLVLNPGQVADLVLAWRQVAGLIAAMPHDRPLADDMASVFRLPPPVGAPVSMPRVAPAAKPRVKPKAKVKAKAKAAPKRRAPPAVPRKPARRGR
jgi:hypothetical protein